ncbi:hypothetical protein ACROYT_G014702 [Oculina patagonica]
MCHLDGLKAARSLLLWPSLWDRAWMTITKIIDVLHMRNHKDKLCKEKYNPAKFKEELPEANTKAAEQNFLWLSRFKKKVGDAQTHHVLPTPVLHFLLQPSMSTPNTSKAPVNKNSVPEHLEEFGEDECESD